jgi:hypothetical protein
VLLRETEVFFLGLSCFNGFGGEKGGGGVWSFEFLTEFELFVFRCFFSGCGEIF